MSRVALLDVNVLIALFDVQHIHHQVAHDWFAEQRPDGWATCPLTENGFVRIVSHPGSRYLDATVPMLVGLLRKFCSGSHHHFWADTPSLRDERLFDPRSVGGSRKVTDAYLLALAVKHGGCLATFDRGIPLDAVTGARPANLAVIAQP